jgi:hypothetical protein
MSGNGFGRRACGPISAPTGVGQLFEGDSTCDPMYLRLMKLEMLRALIEHADFISFRELAQFYLHLRGFVAPTQRDGRNDGGSDFAVFIMHPNPAPFAIQTSVEWNWRSKTLEDARKAKRILGCENFLFVSSRRIPEAEFTGVKDELFREGINASRADSQDIASALVEHHHIPEATRILGIQVDAGGQPERQRLSARNVAAYSYVFFGREPNNFRVEAVQAAIRTVLSDGAKPRKQLEKETCLLLQMPRQQEFVVHGCVDRLIQEQIIGGSDAMLKLADWVQQSVHAVQGIRNKQHDDLVNEITGILSEFGVLINRVGELARATMDDLGALLIEAAHADYSVLSEETRRADLMLEKLHSRIRHLHGLFDATGIPEGHVRQTIIERITAAAAASSYGKSIIAGELFLCLSRSEPSALMRALGDRIASEVVLDASVAIPMIAGLLFRPTDHKYFVASAAIVEAIKNHNIPLILPEDYLGEVAGHLVRAHSRYSEIINIDPDLEQSENAFVVHYVGLKRSGETMDFAHYLQLLGLSPRIQELDEIAAIRVARETLAVHFAHYGIRVTRLPFQRPETRKRAETEVMQLLHQAEDDRPEILVRHDAKVTGYLFDRLQDPFKISILTTWDGLHFRVHQQATNPCWETVNPGVLSDILNLSAHVDKPLVSPTLVAKTLTEEQARLGAIVWDNLANIERGNFHDAELLAKANDFKQTYLSREEFKSDRKSISAAWQRWKREGR